MNYYGGFSPQYGGGYMPGQGMYYEAIFIGDSAMLFQSAAACYYIANEGLSILENAVLMDLPVPGVIKKALEELKEGGDENNGR